jgi:hypothetical protein
MLFPELVISFWHHRCGGASSLRFLAAQFLTQPTLLARADEVIE